jgi:hypothetical protein
VRGQHANDARVTIGRDAVQGPTVQGTTRRVDVYFSADVETDGPIPGPYSMLSFALVFAGTFDGTTFLAPVRYDQSFYAELKPISDAFEPEALDVNKLDRARLAIEGRDPAAAMTEARAWIDAVARERQGEPVLVAYPLSFDWTWLYWYFVRFASGGSPFNHSRCFDLKTAYAIRSGKPISGAGRSKLPTPMLSERAHTHHALDDAVEQAEIFARIFEYDTKPNGKASR